MKRLTLGFACFLLILPFALAGIDITTDVPEAPVNIIVTGTDAANYSFSLSWDPVPGATGYYIYQIPGGSYTRKVRCLATTPDPITVPSAEIKKITLNTEYWYVVTAYNVNGESLPSNHVVVKLTR